MSEFRHDPTIGRWVIIAPERNRRPRSPLPASEQAQGAELFDPACPFCPGNEAMLPAIIAETASGEPPGWRTRVVANKFPAVSQDIGRCQHRAFCEAAPGRGHHEVVIESPRHNDDLTTMSRNEVRDVLGTCRSRYDALMADRAVQSVIVFRNRGSIAGASLQHPHSQIIALERVPPLVQSRQTAMLNYYQEKDCCVLCDMIAHERADGSRLVDENDDFVSFVPFAATAPFEMWLVPKRHQADFGDLSNDELNPFVDVLCNALIRLGAGLHDPSYNYAIDTAPKGGWGALHLHWCLRIVPQLTTPAGFELGSGLPINSSLPEQDAAVLRRAPLASEKEINV
ncbi:MAG: galactose-1-phosphate uridylyltransferase [Methylocystis sp.]